MSTILRDRPENVHGAAVRPGGQSRFLASPAALGENGRRSEVVFPYTMSPEQAASAVLEFQPRVVYPYHYRGQDPAIFKALVEAESDDIEVRLRNWYP